MTSLRSTVSAYSLMRKDKDINEEIDKQIREALCTSEAIEAIKEANLARLRAANTITQTKIEDERFKEKFKDMTRIRNVQGITRELKRLLALPVWSKVDSEYSGSVKIFLDTIKNIENSALDINISVLSNQFRAALYGSFDEAIFYFVDVPEVDGYSSPNVSGNINEIPPSRVNITRTKMMDLVKNNFDRLKKLALRYNISDQKIDLFDESSAPFLGNLTYSDKNDKDSQIMIGQGLNILQKLKIVNSITNILTVGFDNWALLSMLSEDLRQWIDYSFDFPPSPGNGFSDYIFSYMRNKKKNIFIVPKVFRKYVKAIDFKDSLGEYLQKINETTSQTNSDEDALYSMTLQMTKNDHELADHPEADPLEKLQHVSIGDSAVLDSATAGPSNVDDTGAGFSTRTGLTNRSTVSMFSLSNKDKLHFSENAVNPYSLTHPSKSKIKGGALSGEDEKRLKILEAYIKTGGNSIRSLAEYSRLKKRV